MASAFAVSMVGSASAQQASFRVPIGNGAATSASPPVYAWLESISECTSTCGSGDRTTSFQCQNAADFDYSGAGYGAPESDALCTSAVGPRPASTNSSCTNYSGCGYDWVNPPIQKTPIRIEPYPIGRIGCGNVRTVFSPYCQRTGGSTPIVMAANDHRFCRNDTPDYNRVAAGDPDALGYDRTLPEYTACAPIDHEWRAGAYGAFDDTCSTTAKQTRSVICYRKFDNAAVADGSCDAASRPTSTNVQPVYTTCGYDWINGGDANWTAWSSTCSNNANRTRNPQCRRSNGDIVADSSCVAAGKPKPSTSETQGIYSSCTYSAGGTTTNGAWSSTCSPNATRTVTRQCIRSNGDVVADGECQSRSIGVTSSETQAVYTSCNYEFITGGWSAWSNTCTNSANRTRAVNCRRSDGTNVAEAECTNRGIAKPNAGETAAVYDSCSYAAGGATTYGPWSSQCSANAQRTVTQQCIRSNGDAVAASECQSRGVGVTSTQTAAVYDQCGYSFSTGGWSDWNSHCSSSATRTRAVQCYRGDGTPVADGECTNRGVGAPPRSETTAVYDQCGYSRGDYTGSTDWNSHCSSTAYRYNYYNCKRADGTVVANAECTNRGIAVTVQEGGAVYDGCGYSFVPGAWSDWSSHCSANARRNRAVWCYRSDGTMMDPNHQPCYNAGQTYPGFEEYAAVYDGCGFARGDYTGSSDWNSHCSGNAVRTNNYNCKRADGTVVANAECTNRGIAVTEQQGGAVYDQCGYSAVNWTGFSACANGTQTRTAQCQRSDGAIVANSECDNRGQGTTQSQACNSTPICAAGWGPERIIYSEDSQRGINSDKAAAGECTSGQGGTSASSRGNVKECWTRDLPNFTLFGRYCGNMPW